MSEKKKHSIDPAQEQPTAKAKSSKPKDHTLESSSYHEVPYSSESNAIFGSTIADAAPLSNQKLLERQLAQNSDRPIPPHSQKQSFSKTIASPFNATLAQTETEREVHAFRIELPTQKTFVEPPTQKFQEKLEFPTQRLPVEPELVTQRLPVEPELATQRLSVESELPTQRLSVDSELPTQRTFLETALQKPSVALGEGTLLEKKASWAGQDLTLLESDEFDSAFENLLANPDPNKTATGSEFQPSKNSKPKKKKIGQKTERSSLRKYADGLYTTHSGEKINSSIVGTKTFVELPYKSTDVKMRLGNYDIIAELGRGGMGVVYKGYSLSLCRMCAIKVMSVGADISETSMLRFQNEAMLAARLRHPNIVSVFDSGEADGLLYIVMEFIEGRTLTELINEKAPDVALRCLQVIEKIARALDYAHRHQIVHRDIKPDNILLDKNDEPYLTDFGIAKGLDQSLNITAHESLMGTPYYMSPEQANKENESIGPCTDIYSLGATMYHAVVGRPPFVGDNLLQLMMQVIRNEPESPRTVAKRVLQRNIPLDVETICLKSLEKEADRRYETAEDMADDIKAHLEDKPIKARPLDAKERFQKLLRRNRAVFIGATLVLVLMLLMVVGFGSVVYFNMQRTSQSLRDLDRSAAVEQAATLERAIRANMLEGRADIVRELMRTLRKDPKVKSIDVIRTDRTYAYTDLSTRNYVGKRIQDQMVLGWVKDKYPKMISKIKELQRTALKNIDQNPQERRAKFAYDKKKWESLLKHPYVRTETHQVKKEQVLTVLWPIKNGQACQVCHGRVGDPYGSYKNTNRLRAILVVRRSQKQLEKQIRANQIATASIGGITTLSFFFLLFLFSKLFGIGLRPRSFGKSE